MHFMAILAAMAASGISFTRFEGMFIDVVHIPAPVKEKRKVMMRYERK
jgi:hypothetical protein